MYGFYCLESCVVAAALHQGLPRPRSTHPAKVEQARRLAVDHGLPDVEQLLVDLNDRRKFEAYGDSELPEDDDLDAQDVAHDIRAYFEAVEAMVTRPELARQLRLIGEHELSERLQQALVRRQQ